jgi:hypothetical protein
VSTPVIPDASPVKDASAGTVPDARTDEGGKPQPSDAGRCSSTGALTIAGDYVAPDGTEYWLRKTVTATTYTVVPARATAPAPLPKLYRITMLCQAWLALAGTDGSVARLDWSGSPSSLRICVRTAAAKDVATLPDPDGSNDAAGCDGAAWTRLTRSMP